jgi:hypothetical protein
MINTVSGGTLQTPLLEVVIPSRTADNSQTPEFTHSYILSYDQLRNLRAGDICTLPGHAGDWISAIGNAAEWSAGFYRVRVVTIATPVSYYLPVMISAQFLPFYPQTNAADARALLQNSKPFTAEVLGRELVEFIRADAIHKVNAANPSLPTFAGAPVRNYGAVYTDDGRFRGWTNPVNPPSEIVVARRIQYNWRPDWHQLITTYARRPV